MSDPTRMRETWLAYSAARAVMSEPTPTSARLPQWDGLAHVPIILAAEERLGRMLTAVPADQA